jgi:hypothetical protein
MMLPTLLQPVAIGHRPAQGFLYAPERIGNGPDQFGHSDLPPCQYEDFGFHNPSDPDHGERAVDRLKVKLGTRRVATQSVGDAARNGRHSFMGGASLVTRGSHHRSIGVEWTGLGRSAGADSSSSCPPNT